MTIDDLRLRAGTASPSIKADTERVIHEQADGLVGLAQALHADPEPPFSERRASARMVDLLSDGGFEIRTGVAGLATAFIASRGGGALHVAFCAEYDALDARAGHAEGRHLVAGAAIGAALGLAPFADESGLTVSVVGTPGAGLLDMPAPPEGHVVTGKTALFEAGAFDDAHAVLMLIPSHSFTGFGRTCARVRWRARLWDGHTSLRETRRLLEDRVRRAATAPGVAVATWRIGSLDDGATTTAELALDGPTLRQVALAAAAARGELERIATGAGLSLQIVEFAPVRELHNDLPLRRALARNLVALGLVPSPATLLPHSTDLGNVSIRIPVVAPMVSAGVAAAPGAADAATRYDGEVAYRAMLAGAVALAWTALDAASLGGIRSHLLAARELAHRRASAARS